MIDHVLAPKSLDPGREIQPTNYLIGRAAYDTLLTFKGSNLTTPIPSAATSYDVSSNATTFTFHLRKDIKFSDGSPLTAKDVLFSFKRIVNLKGNPSFFLEGVTVTAPDDHTVVLTSQKPNPALPVIVTSPALAILNAKVVRANGGSDAEDAAQADKAEQFLSAHSAGSGPYVLTEYTPSDHVTLKANPHYWGPKPFFETVVIRNMAPATQAINIQRSTADELALDISPDLAAPFKGKTKLRVAFHPTLTIFFLTMQMSPRISPATANLHIRNAVRHGLDYKGIAALAGTGSIQASGLVPIPLLGALPTSVATQRNVAKAKAEVAASGIGNPKVSLSYQTEAIAGVSLQRLAQKIKSDLGQVGITVDLNPGASVTLLTVYRAGTQRDLGLWSWSNDYPDPADYLIFGPGEHLAKRMNWQAGADPQLEQLSRRAASTIDRATRSQLFRQIQLRLNQESPFVPLLQPTQVVVSTSNLTHTDFSQIWLMDIASVASR